MATFRIRDLIVAVGRGGRSQRPGGIEANWPTAHGDGRGGSPNIRFCTASDTRPDCAASGTLPACDASNAFPDCAAGTMPHCAVSGPPPPCAASDTRPNVFGGTLGYAGEPGGCLQSEELAVLKRQLAQAIGQFDGNDRSS